LTRKVILVGLDGLDPSITEALLAAGELPNLARIRERGGYARIGTTCPAQTPVAWSTVATGLNPGGHGIFDFLRRDPATYRPEIALFGYEQRSAFLPLKVANRRQGTPVWGLLSDAGIPSTVLRHPCTYPPSGLRGRLLAGVGVPDIRGGFGTSTIYGPPGTTAHESERFIPVEPSPGGHVETTLIGPHDPKRGREVTLDVALEIDAGRRAVTLRSKGQPTALQIQEGEWSAWLEVTFRVGALQKTRGLVRFFLRRAGEPFELYATPIAFDPDVPHFPISHPWDYAAELKRAIGSYSTLGLAEDHNALNNGRVAEDAFLRQCGDVLRERRAMMHHELARFDRGFFFCLFDTPDRIQHMFWRFRDPRHPANADAPTPAAYEHTIEEHYRECDALVGEALEYADDDTVVLVASDHGFADFRREVHINTWLQQHGFLTLKHGAEPGDASGDLLREVDWGQTQAYALGLAGIYFNHRGREAEGIVRHEETPGIAQAIAQGLTGMRDGERAGASPIRSVVKRDAVYHGQCVGDAPDLLVNCEPGYRVSSATAMGGVPAAVIEDNRKRWSGDHVVDPAAVPGVLFATRPLASAAPTLLDLAPTILATLGVPAPADMEGTDILA
jgi:predicted AlkP superfamily phosphohydrolase/phosphomutase